MSHQLADPLFAQQAVEPAATLGAEEAAARLMAATVTVRVSPSRQLMSGPGAAAGPDPSRDVTVCSGVLLGRGLVVTCANVTSTARFRITLAGGEQAEARLSVIDQYSGLSLLAIDDVNRPGLGCAAAMPRIGGGLLSAAAAGIEPPIVSQGILGAVDRLLAGSGLPPLLQCDLRTTETSSGAAVVDREGNLVGVIVATAAPGECQGWAYAVPVSEVERLRRAYKAGELVLLKRQRPTAGLTLGPGEKEATVEVERVEAGGPADRAGVRKGDLLVEADGRKLRSAYQAVALILKKMPGDEVELVLRRGAEESTVKIVLDGGSAPAPAGPQGKLSVGPLLTLRARAGRQIEVRRGERVEELGAGAAEQAPAAGRLARDELSMLRAQLAAFEKVIQRLQLELARRDELQAKTEAQLEKLNEELARLRKSKDEPDEP